jgi:hypothetical protein
MSHTDTTKLKAELEEELQARALHHCQKGSMADKFKQLCFGLGLLSSLVTSVAALSESLPPIPLGIIAGMPALLHVVQSKLVGRCQWRFQYYHGLKALFNELHYESISNSDEEMEELVASIAHRLSELGAGMNEQMMPTKAQVQVRSHHARTQAIK